MKDNSQKQLQYSGRFVPSDFAPALRRCSGQSGSAFGTAFLGTAEEDAEKVAPQQKAYPSG
jgi:hypothetical protein